MPAAFVLVLATALAAQPAPPPPPAPPAGAPPASDAAPPARLTKLPALTRYVSAPYPPAAYAAGIEATVVLAIDVDATGAVQNVSVLESAGPEFDDAAVRAARGFQFTPAEAEGIGPIPVRITYRYGFVISTPLARTPTVATTTTATSAPSRVATSTVPELIRVSHVNLLGTVKESGTRAPIPFATVRVFTTTVAALAATSTGSTELPPDQALTSTETDDRGRFSLRDVPDGDVVIEVSAPFFETFRARESVKSGEALEVLYFVNRLKRSPYEIVVRARAPRKEVARRTLKREEILRIPGTQGDAIRVVQNLPGVARTPFGLGLLVVRGAPPQDSGVFLDGHRMPLLFHFGGIGGVTSVIHSRTLEEINFYPGGFSPEYGRLSAGIVELKTEAPPTDRVHAEAQLDFVTAVPVTASVFVTGPVTSDPDDGAFVLSLRRSSIDGVLALVTELFDLPVAIAPRFYDYQLRYDRPLGSKKRRLTLFGYGSDDELVFVGSDSLAVGSPTQSSSRTWFHRINPRFTYEPDKDTRFTISPIFGIDFTKTQTDNANDNGDFLIKIANWNVGLRMDGEIKPASWLRLTAGGDLLYFDFSAETVLPAFTPVRDFPSPVPVDTPSRRDEARVHALAASVYAELEVKPFDKLTLWPGLRFDTFDYQADEQTGVDSRLIEGRSQVGVDPRLTARFALTEALSLKAQAGIYRQPPLPPQAYINADLPLQTANQYSGGIDWEIIANLSLDLQGYYRFAYDVPRNTSDTVVLADGRIRPVGFKPDGEQQSYGLELLLKLENKWGLFGWVAYTLSRSEIRRTDEEWQPNPFFDQTHNLLVTAVYEIALDWHVGMRFRYVTGGGLPRTTARWFDADADAYRRETNEQDRAPPFHQLDLLLEKVWRFEEWQLTGTFDVQNVYNRVNTEVYAPTFDFKNVVPIPGLPFFPSFILKGEF